MKIRQDLNQGARTVDGWMKMMVVVATRKMLLSRHWKLVLLPILILSQIQKHKCKPLIQEIVVGGHFPDLDSYTSLQLDGLQVLVLFSILILLWFFKTPLFMPGWGDLFQVRGYNDGVTVPWIFWSTRRAVENHRCSQYRFILQPNVNRQRHGAGLWSLWARQRLPSSCPFSSLCFPR